MRVLAWVLPFALTFLAAAWLTALLIRIAPKRGWVSSYSSEPRVAAVDLGYGLDRVGR